MILLLLFSVCLLIAFRGVIVPALIRFDACGRGLCITLLCLREGTTGTRRSVLRLFFDWMCGDCVNFIVDWLSICDCMVFSARVTSNALSLDRSDGLCECLLVERKKLCDSFYRFKVEERCDFANGIVFYWMD